MMRAADLHIDPARGGWVELYDASSTPLMRHFHRHDELEANVVVRGWAEYLIADRRVRFPQHALGWLLPHQTHRLIHRSADLRMWIAVFTPEIVASLEGTPADDPEDGAQVRQIGRDMVELTTLLARVAAPGVEAGRHRAGLTWLLSECRRSYGEARGGTAGTPLHPAVEAAARWLHDHATAPEADDLQALARRCRISRPWLSRLFAEQLGESLTDYRNRQRFYRFRELLARPGGGSVTEAALAAGFGSYAQCFRIVRANTGLSPRELARTLAGPGR